MSLLAHGRPAIAPHTHTHTHTHTHARTPSFRDAWRVKSTQNCRNSPDSRLRGKTPLTRTLTGTGACCRSLLPALQRFLCQHCRSLRDCAPPRLVHHGLAPLKTLFDWVSRHYPFFLQINFTVTTVLDRAVISLFFNYPQPVVIWIPYGSQAIYTKVFNELL